MAKNPMIARSITVLSTIVILGSLALAGSPSATAAETPDWGPQGDVTTTDSAVTVRWDNKDNPAEDAVPRNKDQVLAHSAGKTYDNLKKGMRDAFQSFFGADNGLGGLSMHVSQTRDLVNQTVNVSFSGAKGGAAGLGSYDTTFLRLFQCWGAPDENGEPDPAATSPDPETCQTGVGAFDDVSARNQNIDPNDFPLLAGGDRDGATSYGFRAIGTSAPGSLLDYFTSVTTNEQDQFSADIDGAGSRPFEIQTGAEAPGLGCGFRSDAPSTDTCWLVAVPMNNAAFDPYLRGQSNALSPSFWANRLQVKLSMAPVTQACPADRAQTLTLGSELLPSAMRSWIPGICSAKNISLGYTVLGDGQARQSLSSGAQDVIFTTQPVTGTTATLNAPVALAGVTIAFTVDNPITATRNTQLKLDARLVAKMLTESYQAAIDDSGGSQVLDRAPWVTDLPKEVYKDPEFFALNPDLRVGGDFQSGGDLVVSALRSDAAQAIWTWLLNDPAARSFLDGCPDENGMVINPFFSTRSYAECSADSAELEAAAKLKRDATDTPDTYEDAPMVYPSDGSLFPQPGWYERAAIFLPSGKKNQSALTLADLHPRLNTLADTGRTAFRAVYPNNTIWCSFASDPLCKQPDVDGMWKPQSKPQTIAARTIYSATDSSIAAQYQLPTAALCDDSGEHCVGADTQSLQKAADSFVASGTQGVSLPPAQPDYAAGAYPLALPVYAAVGTSDLGSEDAATIADVLDYLSTAGQVPGRKPGQLPPGYAPMTDAMVAQTAAVVHELRNPPTEQQTPPQTQVSTVKPPLTPPVAVVPKTPKVPVVSTQPPQAPAVPPVDPTTAALAGAATGPTEIGFPQFGLIAGFGGALLAALVAPIVGRRRKVTR